MPEVGWQCPKLHTQNEQPGLSCGKPGEAGNLRPINAKPKTWHEEGATGKVKEEAFTRQNMVWGKADLKHTTKKDPSASVEMQVTNNLYCLHYFMLSFNIPFNYFAEAKLELLC